MSKTVTLRLDESINRDVPRENIIAFHEAMEEYGAYTNAGGDSS